MSIVPLPSIDGIAAIPPPRSLKLHEPHELRLVVVVPALNEAHVIGEVLERIPRRLPGIGEVTVVVVDDGSTDETAEIARAAGAIVVSHPRVCGVGAALQTGLRKTLELGGDLMVNLDGDGLYPPEEIPRLLAPLLAGQADFVTASRFSSSHDAPQMPPIERWGNRQISRLISRLAGTNFHDVSCALRAYNHAALMSLSLLEPLTYTHEVFLHLSTKRMRIVEVPVAVTGKRLRRPGRNLWQNAASPIKIVLRYGRDYHSLKFFGAIAGALFAVGVPLLTFCLWHYLRTGWFSPHKWSGFMGGGICALGCAALLMGIVGDMLNRQRLYLEEILYYLRSLVGADSRRGH